MVKGKPAGVLKLLFDYHERWEWASFTYGVGCFVPTGSLWAAKVNTA